MLVQVYIDGKLVLEGRGSVDAEHDDQIELIVEDEQENQFLVQVPTL